MIDNIVYKDINGVRLCFIQKKGYREKEAMVAFNYGSSENRFKISSEEVSLPAGIAHFLEHKIFEDEEYNVFEVFNKLGANINAFTNFTTTAYYFTCVENFYENFCELLKLVSRPYFTTENVEKEKGIIEQEIKMYDDDPYWKVYFNLISTMYNEDNPITKDIAGKVSDIKKIDKDMLYTCYNEFYTKDNALIICCGDISDMRKLENLISDNLKLNDVKKAIVNHFEEKEENRELFVEKKMEINQKIFNIGFKDEEKDVKMEEQIIISKILLDIIFGKSSKFYEKMYNKGIIDNSFGFDYNCIQDYSFYLFSGISQKPENILQFLKDEILKFKNTGIEKKDFERIKNKQIGNFVRQFNFIDSIVNMEADFFSRGFNITSYYKAFEDINFDKVEKRLKSFSEDGFLSIIS